MPSISPKSLISFANKFIFSPPPVLSTVCAKSPYNHIRQWPIEMSALVCDMSHKYVEYVCGDDHKHVKIKFCLTYLIFFSDAAAFANIAGERTHDSVRYIENVVCFTAAFVVVLIHFPSFIKLPIHGGLCRNTAFPIFSGYYCKRESENFFNVSGTLCVRVFFSHLLCG